MRSISTSPRSADSRKPCFCSLTSLSIGYLRG
jgi:hypothetical protein